MAPRREVQGHPVMVGHVFLGRYQALRLLGEGGMGQVYLARQLDNGRQVVVKVIREDLAVNPKVRENFQREMDFMARFVHPYAVRLYEGSLDDPQGPCIVMEYIPGITLEQLLEQQGRIGLQRVGRILGQLCQVLQAAQAIGIIHQDLKPANIMVVDPNAPTEKIKVMDFGLAKLDAKPHIPLEKLADPSAFVACGTPDYICPEAVRGDEVDHRGDIYCVGVILYEMLSGKRPFEGNDIWDVLLAHKEKKPPRFADVGAKWVPPEVEAVVMMCLSKFPNERPQSARELADRFGKALGQNILVEEEAPPVIIRPPPLRVESPKPVPDANTVVTTLEAWMPERIAVIKLRGFVQDMGGEVVESVPGLIRVHLPDHPKETKPQQGLLGWLGLGKKKDAETRQANGIDLELHMEKKDAGRQTLLQVTVLLRPEGGRRQASEPGWKDRCDVVLRELRAYLIGSLH